MSFLRVKKLHGSDLRQLRQLIKKPSLSLDYLVMSDCYGFFSGGEMFAGYCITHAPLDEMSAIGQIPQDQQRNMGAEDPFKYAELTGFFIKGKKHRLVIKLHMLAKIVFHKAKYFVYAYPTEQTKIETQAALGSPLRIYSGKPEVGVGGDGILLPKSINVEIISKVGILRIVLSQAKKRAKRLLHRLCNRF